MQKNRKKVLTFCNTDSILIKSVAVATDEYGILAQLGEHLPYKQRVIGSSPIGPISRESFLKSKTLNAKCDEHFVRCTRL